MFGRSRGSWDGGRQDQLRKCAELRSHTAEFGRVEHLFDGLGTGRLLLKGRGSVGTSRGSTGTAERSRGQALADAVRAAADAVVATLTTDASDRPREEWVAVVAACQSLVNTTTAAQDVALAEVARREGCWRDDGSVGEDVHPPGAVTLDAADLVAPELGASHGQAERRVLDAVRLAAGREPVEADSREVAQQSGLGGLHSAMVAGLLDGYRAGVVAYELQEAPADVADAVVAALDGHLGDDAPSMRRRVRRMLARISPDLLRQRAERARASTGLRRWVAEPGVDAWFGTFPSEDAASAWAAIDRLAHDYVAKGTCSSVEQARGRALTDLVTGNATVDVRVVLTVPADACPTDATRGRAHSERSTPEADSVTTCHDAAKSQAAQAEHAKDAVHAERSHRDDGTERDDCAELGQGGERADSMERAQDAERGEDLVEVHGARPSEPLFVRRSWLTDHLAVAPAGASRGGREKSTGPLVAPCHALTGARIDAARGPRDARVPPGARAGGAGPSARRPVPVPRVRRRRHVLRSRPRAALADRPHRRPQPHLPLPAPPQDQADPRVAPASRPRRYGDVEGSDRSAPSHHAAGRTRCTCAAA